MRKPKPDVDEQYAFEDFLQKRLSREWALYEWQRQRTKPIKKQKEPDDEPRIDFQGPKPSEILDGYE